MHEIEINDDLHLHVMRSDRVTAKTRSNKKKKKLKETGIECASKIAHIGIAT